MIHHPERRAIPDRDPRRNVWLILVLHVAAFALVVFGYSDLSVRYPDLLATNTARLALPIWMGVLLLHLLVTLVIDRVQTRRRARLLRIQRRLNNPEDGTTDHEDTSR